MANKQTKLSSLSLSDETAFNLSLLKATLNVSQDGILVVDHRSGKVRDCNLRFLELWKIPMELASKKDDRLLIDFVLAQLDNPEQFLSLVKELYQDPMRKSFDVLYFKDGKIFERHSEPLMLDEHIEGRVWFFRDITEKTQKDILLVNSARLASLGEMAGGIAHEINNPLSIIQMKAFQIKHMLKDEDGYNKALCLQELEKIDKTVERIAKIVRGLRIYCYSGEDKTLEKISLISLLDDTLEICKQRFVHHAIKIEVATIPDLYIYCQRTELTQVLLNLLNNAYDAVEDLETKWIKLDLHILTNTFEISVTDSGKGIPKQIAEKLMKPFFTTKQAGKGTGLGLSISKKIMEEHEGKLKYDATSPNTRFVLEFPRKILLE